MPRSQTFVPIPVKKRDSNKTQTLVHLKHIEQQHKHLQERIVKLLNPVNTPSPSDGGSAGEDAFHGNQETPAEELKF